MACGHCSVESGPNIKGEPTEAELLQIVRDGAKAGMNAILLTGGEPMLRPKIVFNLLDECRRNGIDTAMTTNGYWGRKGAFAQKTMKNLIRHGLGAMTVSYDRYHAEYQDADAVINIANAAERHNFEMNINFVRMADDPELVTYVERFKGLRAVRLRYYDVQPVGRARNFAEDQLRAEVEGFCSAAARPAVTDDGRLIACNGPSYFESAQSPLIVGKLGEHSVGELLDKFWKDPILHTIRTFGASRLRDEIRKIPELKDFAFRETYRGMCDLCLHINSSPEVIAPLRKHLSAPKLEAERAAKWQLILRARSSGELTREHANGPAASRIFLHAAIKPGEPWPEDIGRVFGRADVEWNQLTQYIPGCGLAGPVMHIGKDAEMKRWAPKFFLEELGTRAARDAIRELIQHEAADMIAEELKAMNAIGVPLKGWAIYAMERLAGKNKQPRVPGDLDLWVPNGKADELRRRLIARGFGGKIGDPRTGPHHLAPVIWRGVSLEIHTNVLPAFWGFPEEQALSNLLPLGDAPYRVLPAEEMLLHVVMHNTTHLFTHGLKCAYDVLRILDLWPQPNWELLTGLIAKTRCPRAFWVPATLLNRELGIGFPAQFMANAPCDVRERRLELVAASRIFVNCESADELNPFTRNGIFLLMFDSLLARTRYIANLSGGEAAASRKTAMAKLENQSWNSMPRHLRQAWSDFRRFRRAVGRLAPMMEE